MLDSMPLIIINDLALHCIPIELGQQLQLQLLAAASYQDEA